MVTCSIHVGCFPRTCSSEVERSIAEMFFILFYIYFFNEDFHEFSYYSSKRMKASSFKIKRISVRMGVEHTKSNIICSPLELLEMENIPQTHSYFLDNTFTLATICLLFCEASMHVLLFHDKHIHTYTHTPVASILSKHHNSLCSALSYFFDDDTKLCEKKKF